MDVWGNTSRGLGIVPRPLDMVYVLVTHQHIDHIKQCGTALSRTLDPSTALANARATLALSSVAGPVMVQLRRDSSELKHLELDVSSGGFSVPVVSVGQTASRRLRATLENGTLGAVERHSRGHVPPLSLGSPHSLPVDVCHLKSSPITDQNHTFHRSALPLAPGGSSK